MHTIFAKGAMALAFGATLAFGGAIDQGMAQTTPANLQATTGVTIESGSARPIPGWVDFCQRNPQECIIDRSEPEILHLDQKSWRLINEVNRAVNAEIKPRTDEELFGMADFWTFPDSGYGDCEDYQLLKRQRLADAGLPRRAMRMTVVIDELNEGHAVLMIRTDRGDFILDNKHDEILSWHETPYVYVSRESQHATSWTSLGHASGPTVTANR